MKRRLRMLATVSLLALTPGMSRAGGIPVVDAAANASLVTQIAQGAEQLGQWAQQIKAMVDLLTLQNIAAEVLGETVGGEFAQLIDAASSLYHDAGGLYGSIVSKQAQWEAEIGTFMPPQGGYEDMTTAQLIARARQMQRLLTEGTAQVQLAQSKLIDRQAAYMRQAMAGGAQADRSRSAVAATQAAAHILAAQAGQLQAINHTLGTMAMTIENRILTEESRLQINQEMQRNDVEAMRQRASVSPGSMTISPIQWGR